MEDKQREEDNHPLRAHHEPEVMVLDQEQEEEEEEEEEEEKEEMRNEGAG